MGVMPLPQIQTIWVGGWPKLDVMEPLSIIEFGRLHFSFAEKQRIERWEKGKVKEMGFSLVKKSELPVVRIGAQAATEPIVGISEGGQMVFNSFIGKEWKGTHDRVVLFFDPEARKVAFVGVKNGVKLQGVPEGDIYTLSVAKEKDGTPKKDAQMRIGAGGFLKEIAKYNYKGTGNQTYTASLETVTGKIKGYVIQLPAIGKEPAPRPKRERKAAAVGTKNGANGAAVPVKPPTVEEAQEELVMD